VFVAPEGRTILVFGHPMAGQGSGFGMSDFVEVVLLESSLRAAMVRYGLNILGLSIIISVIAAALVYFALNRLLVQPMMRLTRSMLSFGRNPEDASRIIDPSSRTDEIGTAERELAHMQQELLHMLQQKNRLAQLGLAMSKINHDLRNMLANAQLLSDRLGALPDPAVQSFAPKLIAALDRAINFCNDTLRFGRAEEAAPRRELIRLAAVLGEVSEGLGLPREAIAWQAEIDPALLIDADRDHLYRILNNLARNAVQAIEGQGAGARGEIHVTGRREGRRVVVEMRDSGPGLTEQAKSNLFRAFQGGTRKGGSGLGLAISAELVAAHGGRLEPVASEAGAAFRFDIPDRDPAAAA
jgi:signal transduction histidine kinase